MLAAEVDGDEGSVPPMTPERIQVYTSTKGSHLDFSNSKALEVVVVQEEGTSCTICHEDVALGHQLVLPGCDAGLLHGAHIMCMTIWLMTR